jgi:23S rRNA (adenine2503-C2)-methyltransferase
MGMGEPFDNWDNLHKALCILNAPQGMNIGARRMTISTSGHVPGIHRLMETKLQINLSISLHATTDETRGKLMPMNRIYPIQQLLTAAKEYYEATGRRVTLEYVLLYGINDLMDDANRLAKMAHDLFALVNILPYNPIKPLVFKPSPPDYVETFVTRLTLKKVSVTVRQSKGKEIHAACGQLAGNI